MKVQKLYKIRVKGIVQGVFFRKTAQQRARELNLTGFVENKADESVYIEAQGEEQALRKLVEWCHEGPPRAEVDSVKYEEGPTIEFTDFSIKR